MSAELHLDYGVLKRRAGLAGSKTPASELAPRFVELFGPTMPATPSAAHPQCVLEMDNTRGAKRNRQPSATNQLRKQIRKLSGCHIQPLLVHLDGSFLPA